MDIGLLNIMRTVRWDFRHDMAQNYANALKNAIELHVNGDVKKKEGFFLSLKGGKTIRGNFEDKLYVGNIHRIENHLRYNEEELADDDQIINVVVIDGPVTRDGGACSYGTKDFRDQVMYANTIPQVVGHLFVVNTPGGESVCRKDYEMMINDCREKGKPTVMFVDGMCCSSGVNLGCRCDRTVVMNPKDDFGCIGSMAAFWATPDGAVDQDGTRYVEIVGESSPGKNDWYRDAAAGDYEKLQEMVNNDTEDFHQTVRENRPLVQDWMLTGSTFQAEKLIPALVDEIGNMDRAIQCVLDLAAGKLSPARDAVKSEDEQKPEEKTETGEKEPEENPEPQQEPEPPTPEGVGEQSEIDKLNNQQRTAMSAKPGETMIVDNGHVREVAITPFGQEEHEIATPQNNKDMTDEEKKAQDAAKQNEEKPEEKPTTKEPEKEEPEKEETAKEDPEGNPEKEDPEKEKPEEADPKTEVPEPEKENPNKETPGDDPKKEDPDEEKPNEEGPEKKDATELAKVKDALHSAETLVADRDKQIAEKDAAIAERSKDIKEKDALIAKMKKQIADLQNEVKELAAAPTPMADGNGGVPKDNGTGSAETGAVKSVINANMSPAEIRSILRKQDKDIAEKRRRK